MADPLDLLERDYRETTRALDVADHNRNWANTFSNTPPTEVLRANRNYDDLVSQAIEQRAQLGALTDPKQQKILHEAQLQPLREELLRGQIEHQAASTLAAGALERFRQKKDRETMADTVSYLDWMEKAPDRRNVQAYRTHVIEGLKKFPGFMSNAAGKDILKSLAQESDGIATLHDATVTRYARVQGELESHKTASELEKQKNMAANEPNVPYTKSAEEHAARAEAAILEGAHPELKAVTPKTEPSATPKRLKFNPKTGKLE